MSTTSNFYDLWQLVPTTSQASWPGISLSQPNRSICLLGCSSTQWTLSTDPASFRTSWPVKFLQSVTCSICLLSRRLKPSFTPFPQLRRFLQSTVDRIHHWLSCHNFRISLKKTQLMIFTNRSLNPPPLTLTLNNAQSPLVEPVKVLGLYFKDRHS